MEKIIQKASFTIATFGIVLLSLVFPKVSRAQYYSQGGNNINIAVDKKVRALDESTFFDNIDKSTKIFTDNEGIEFSVKVTNTGSNTLNNISVKDTLPQHLILVFYPGVFNKNLNSITWNIDKLNSGEYKLYYIRARIDYIQSIQVGPIQTLKMTNKVEVSVNNLNDSDSASYYIGPKIMPKTGNDDLLLKTGALFLLVLSGLYFRKAARGY